MEAKIRSTEERLEEALFRIRKINFFQPDRSLEEANSLVQTVDEIIEDHINFLKPWKGEDMGWGFAYLMAVSTAWSYVWSREGVKFDKVFEEVRDKTYDRVRKAVCDVAGTEGCIKANRIAWSVVNSVENYIAFETVRGLPRFEKNPAEPIIRLYEMGLYPKGFRKVNGEEKFIVDFPLDINGEKILGCYANRDEKIRFGHKWEDYCKNLRYLKFPRRVIE